MDDADEADPASREPDKKANRISETQDGSTPPQHQDKTKQYADRTKKLWLRFVWGPLGRAVSWLDSHDGLVTAIATVAIATFTIDLLFMRVTKAGLVSPKQRSSQNKKTLCNISWTKLRYINGHGSRLSPRKWET